MDEYRYIGDTPTDLEGGRPIAPGDYTGPIDVSEFVTSIDEETGEESQSLNKNYQLLEEGFLLVVEVPAELSGSELETRAKELNIEGRSKMSAEELRDAIATAETEAAQGGAGEEVETS